MSDIKLLFNASMQFSAIADPIYKRHIIVLHGTTENGWIHHSHIMHAKTKRSAEKIAHAGNQLLNALYPESKERRDAKIAQERRKEIEAKQKLRRTRK